METSQIQLQKQALILLAQRYYKKLKQEGLNLFQNYDKLGNHQKFMALLYTNPTQKNILAYQKVGSGKTILAIAIINAITSFINIQTNIIILAPKAILKDTWVFELKKWIIINNVLDKQIVMVEYDQQQSFEDLKQRYIADLQYKNNVFIVDEAHNIITSVYKKTKDQQSFVQVTARMKQKLVQQPHTIIPNTIKFYNFLQEVAQMKNNKMVLLTGTPINKHPFELSLYMDIIQPGIITTDIQQFNTLYIDPVNNDFKKGALNSLSRRLQGFISFYEPISDLTQFAEKILIQNYVEPSELQFGLYKLYRSTENVEIGGKKQRGFRIPTLMACCFCLPNTKLFNPLHRNFEETCGYQNQVEQYFQQRRQRDPHFLQEVLKIKDKLLAYKVKECDKWRDQIFSLVRQSNSTFLKELYQHSVKYINVIFAMTQREGPCMVYSSIIQYEGIETFKIYLRFFGFTDGDSAKDKDQKEPIIRQIWGFPKTQSLKYAMYYGGMDIKQRTQTLQKFNDHNNVAGHFIKVILMSKIAQEGISLQNVRQIHLLSPQTDETKNIQIEARGIRFKSHLMLPVSERYVQVFRYILRFNKKQQEIIQENSTDLDIYIKSQKTAQLQQKFNELLQSTSIDCTLYQKCECFRLPDEKYFDDDFDLYLQDPVDDIQMQIGSFSYGARLEAVQMQLIQYIDVNGQLVYGFLNMDNDIIYDQQSKLPITKLKTFNRLRYKNEQGYYMDYRYQINQNDVFVKKE